MAVLGAGRVSHPCVQYLLRSGLSVTLVDINEENMKRVSEGHPHCRLLKANAAEAPEDLLSSISCDLVIALLPPECMPKIAQACLDLKIPFIDPNYLDEGTKALRGSIERAGLPFVVEMGLDPGIDHMTASKEVREIHERGGRVESFRSLCGALPALEANTNPWGYKLSWSPSTLIAVSRRDARILLPGKKEVFMPNGTTYEHPFLTFIEGIGWFEAYANADSLPYVEAYGMPEVEAIYRGTLRYTGWCETICAMNALALVEQEEQDFSGLTFARFMARQAGSPEVSNPKEAVCQKLGLPPYSAVILRFEWLGLFDDSPIPFRKGSARDVISYLFGQKLVFSEGERDLIILEDVCVAFFPENKERRKLTSLLADCGDPKGDSAIAKTTGLPPAVTAKLILEGKIHIPGIRYPSDPDIYEAVLPELEKEGIRFSRREEVLYRH